MSEGNFQTETVGGGGSFALGEEGALPANLRGYYRRPYAEYAKVYGYHPVGGVRTIKRFVQIGRAARDLPPLDEPGRMVEWYRVHHGGRSAPEGMRRAAAGGEVVRGEGKVEVVAAAPAGGPSAVVVEGDDFPSQVAHLRADLTAQRLRIKKLKEEEPPAGLGPVEMAEWARAKAERIEGESRTFNKDFDTLRKAENDLLAWLKGHEFLVPRDAVASDMGRIVGAVHVATRRLVQVVRPLLVGKSEGEQERIWGEKHRECFRILKASKFGAEFVLEP